jgi:Na+-driven multidrug efflux pump
VLAARLGVETAAAHEVALTYLTCSAALAGAIARAGALRVGEALAARTPQSATRRLRGTFVLVTLSSLCVAVCGWGLLRALGGWASVAVLAPSLLFVAPLVLAAQLGDTSLQLAVRTLRIVGQQAFGVRALIGGVVIIGVPLAVALGDWGGTAPAGIWLALSATVCAVGVVTAARAYWLISAGAPVPGPTTGEYAFPGIADG